MKLTIEQQNLAAIIARVINAVEKRNTIPILGHVLLKAYDTTLSATGTDLDCEVKTTAEAEVLQSGSVAVSASMMQAIVAKLGKGKLVTLESDGLTLRIKSGRSELQLACLPIEDFPQIASSDYDSEFKIDQSEIKRLIELSSFAMSAEETRYYLNGVYLHAVNGAVRAVATDGHRLAQIDSAAEASFPSVIVPRKTVGLFKSLLDSGSATIRVSEAKIQMDVGHSIVTSKVIDGTYPDYTRVIPATHKTQVVVSAADVKQAAALVSLVSAEKNRAVKVNASGETLTLEVRSGSEVGVEDVDAVITGEPVVVGVSSKYLADVLQACNGDNAIMRFIDSGSPIVVIPEDDDKALFVVMPMRI